MDASDDHPPLEPRLPDTDDLVLLCGRLNGTEARYKQTYRDKDALDRHFLRELLKGELPPDS